MPETYGQTIARLRLEQGLTRSDLARSAGMSYIFVMDIERGSRVPSAEGSQRLLAALGVVSE